MWHFWAICGWYWLIFHCLALVIVLLHLRKSLYGKVLAAGFSLSLAYWVTFRIAIWFGAPWSILDMASLLNLYGYILVCLGIASIRTRKHGHPGAEPLRQGPEQLSSFEYKIRNPLITALLVLVTINIYWLVWLYRSVRELRQLRPKNMTFTPGKAIGYMFIPFFNIYWFVKVSIRFPQAIRELTEQFWASEADSAYSSPFVSVLLILSIVTNAVVIRFSLCFLLIGELMFITAIAYTQRYINHVWFALAAASRQGTDAARGISEDRIGATSSDATANVPVQCPNCSRTALFEQFNVQSDGRGRCPHCGAHVKLK